MSYVNKTNNLVPSHNAVYVDNDWQALRAKGLLAYKSFEEACFSWNANGEARTRFGVPSATNPGVIILGVGQIELGTSTTNANNQRVDLTTDFVSVVGQGKGVSILGAHTFGVSNGLLIATQHSNWSNMTIRATSLVNVSVSTSGTLSGVFTNIAFDGDCSQQSTIWGSHTGAFYNCDFDGSTKSTNALVAQFGGTVTANFYNCNFIGNSSLTTLVNFSCTDITSIFEGCTFTGNVSGQLVQTGGSAFRPRMIGCYFKVQSATGLAFNAADNDCEVIFHACHFFCSFTTMTLANMVGRLRIIASYIFTTSSHNAIEITSISGGSSIICQGSSIISAGSGLAINSSVAANIEISQCALHRPTGGVAGSSISSNLTNVITFPCNSETAANTI